MSAIRKAEDAYRAQGILTGEIVETKAELTTLGDADRELSEWGAVLASYTEYPPANTAVWLVRIVGYAKEPGPPGHEESLEQCTEMRAVITVDPFEDFHLFGRPSTDC